MPLMPPLNPGLDWSGWTFGVSSPLYLRSVKVDWWRKRVEPLSRNEHNICDSSFVQMNTATNKDFICSWSASVWFWVVWTILNPHFKIICLGVKKASGTLFTVWQTRMCLCTHTHFSFFGPIWDTVQYYSDLLKHKAKEIRLSISLCISLTRSRPLSSILLHIICVVEMIDWCDLNSANLQLY